MNKNKIDIDLFNSTNALKVLSYLASNPGKELLGSEIQKTTAISRIGLYLSLKELTRQGLVSRTKRGKFLFYLLNYNEPVVKQFKVLKNIILLRPLIKKIKSLSKKIILYGSAGRGEDYPESDIDLFVLAKDAQLVKDLVFTFKTKRKIQAAIMSPTEFADLKEKERIFYEEVNRGIILWEEKD